MEKALLLTDVVDSTRMSEELGDARAAAVWSAHDRVARDLLPRWRGREIDKTDGMLLLFDAACDAANYAFAYHRALAAFDPPLKARAGLHVGPVILRENIGADVALGAKPLEVEGTAKSVTARIMSIASGGQTLLSTEARCAIGESAVRVVSHGHWRMKGLAEPVEIFEIGEAAAAFLPPQDAAKGYRVVRQGDLWRPARAIKNSLPAERDSFVGRGDVQLDLARRFESARLVSLLGPGGSGKTRLATRFGWSWLGDFPGGVWFCDLSQARTADGIAHAVAQGLDVPLGKQDPVTQLARAIDGRGTCLVILDNFEQVARFAEETVGHWLERARQARFLVTTREVLAVRGEEILALAPLGREDAASLFIRRAAAANPDFDCAAADREVILRLADLLDGLPLAIELAAARIRIMQPSALLARMGERFNILTSAGGRLDRQAMLRTTFDWSWDLLTTPEKAALAQLSVFEGGFTLESAEAIVDLSDCPHPPAAMDALQSLVQKSFVRQVSDSRFNLLISVKEYAADHLRAPDRFPGGGAECARAAELRHGEFFAAFTEAAAIHARHTELDNFIVACRRAVARGDSRVAARTLEHAWTALRFRGPFRAAVDLATLVRDVPGMGTMDRARVEWVAGRALVTAGRHVEASAHLATSLSGAREAGDRVWEGRALLSIGAAALETGGAADARARYDRALAIAREISDRDLECAAVNGVGNAAAQEGRLDEARARYEEALALVPVTSLRDLEGSILGNLATLYGVSLGLIDLSRSHHEAALVVARQWGDRRLEANCLCNLGALNEVDGRLDDAREQLEQALDIARDLGNRLLESIVRCNLGLVMRGMKRIAEAATCFEAALAIARELHDQRAEGQYLGYLGLLLAHEGRFERAREMLAKGEKLLRTISDQLSLGILLAARAETEALAKDLVAARAAYDEARSIAGAAGTGPRSELGAALARVRIPTEFPA